MLLTLIVTLSITSTAEGTIGEQISAVSRIAGLFGAHNHFQPPYRCPSGDEDFHFFRCDATRQQIVQLRLYTAIVSQGRYVRANVDRGLFESLRSLSGLTKLEISGAEMLFLEPLNDASLLPNLRTLSVVQSTYGDTNWERLFEEWWNYCVIAPAPTAAPNCIGCVIAPHSKCSIKPYNSGCADWCSPHVQETPTETLALITKTNQQTTLLEMTNTTTGTRLPTTKNAESTTRENRALPEDNLRGDSGSAENTDAIPSYIWLALFAVTGCCLCATLIACVLWRHKPANAEEVRIEEAPYGNFAKIRRTHEYGAAPQQPIYGPAPGHCSDAETEYSPAPRPEKFYGGGIRDAVLAVESLDTTGSDSPATLRRGSCGGSSLRRGSVPIYGPGPPAINSEDASAPPMDSDESHELNIQLVAKNKQ